MAKKILNSRESVRAAKELLSANGFVTEEAELDRWSRGRATKPGGLLCEYTDLNDLLQQVRAYSTEHPKPEKSTKPTTGKMRDRKHGSKNKKKDTQSEATATTQEQVTEDTQTENAKQGKTTGVSELHEVATLLNVNFSALCDFVKAQHAEQLKQLDEQIADLQSQRARLAEKSFFTAGC